MIRKQIVAWLVLAAFVVSLGFFIYAEAKGSKPQPRICGRAGYTQQATDSAMCK